MGFSLAALNPAAALAKARAVAQNAAAKVVAAKQAIQTRTVAAVKNTVAAAKQFVQEKVIPAAKAVAAKAVAAKAVATKQAIQTSVAAAVKNTAAAAKQFIQEKAIPAAQKVAAKAVATKQAIQTKTVQQVKKAVAAAKEFMSPAKSVNSTTLSCPSDPCQGIGIADKENTAEFAKSMKDLQSEWPKLTAEQREGKLEKALNAQLSKGGVPKVPVETMKFEDTRSGQYDPQTRAIQVNESLLNKSQLSSADAKELANTLYHEARHAEQWHMMDEKPKKDPWRAACGQKMKESVYGTGRTHRESTLTELSRSGNEVARTSAELEKLRANSKATTKDIASAEDNYSRALKDLNKVYPDYKALPEEADAWRTGDAMDAFWK